jgi:hypothetical protein
MARLRQLLGEIELIGWGNVDFEDFHRISLRFKDAAVCVDLSEYPSVSVDRIAAQSLLELYNNWSGNIDEWIYIENASELLKAYFIDHCRLQLPGYCTVDVQLRVGKPRVKFNGPLDKVQEYLEMHSAYQWDSSLDYLGNLQLMFKCKFDKQQVDACAECGICMASEQDGQLPTVKCPADNCGQMYHASCVKEWFTSISRQSKWIIGACPYCSHTITLAA